MSTFIIEGEPTGKARPRVTRFGTHNTEKTVLYENLVKISYKQQCSEFYPEHPLRMSIVAVFKIPKSISKKEREKILSRETYYRHKVDADNAAKIVMDSLNGIAYADDAQIVELYVKKIYGEKPMVQVTLLDLEGENSP